jgi:hypothetical protein
VLCNQTYRKLCSAALYKCMHHACKNWYEPYSGSFFFKKQSKGFTLPFMLHPHCANREWESQSGANNRLIGGQEIGWPSRELRLSSPTQLQAARTVCTHPSGIALRARFRFNLNEEQCPVCQTARLQALAGCRWLTTLQAGVQRVGFGYSQCTAC